MPTSFSSSINARASLSTKSWLPPHPILPAVAVALRRQWLLVAHRPWISPADAIIIFKSFCSAMVVDSDQHVLKHTAQA